MRRATRSGCHRRSSTCERAGVTPAVGAAAVAVPGPVLAGGISAGGVGFLVVLMLLLAAVGLFVAMSGSLKRMRRNVSQGTFRGTPRRRGGTGRPPGEPGAHDDAGASGPP